MAANSAQHNAPVIVRTPASAHATSNQPGDPINREDSAEVIKMPEPIMEPTTIMLASITPRPRTSFGEEPATASLIKLSRYSCLSGSVSRKTLLDTPRDAQIVLLGLTAESLEVR